MAMLDAFEIPIFRSVALAVSKYWLNIVPPAVKLLATLTAVDPVVSTVRAVIDESELLTVRAVAEFDEPPTPTPALLRIIPPPELAITVTAPLPVFPSATVPEALPLPTSPI
jgi:hypothetical protein